MFDDSRTNASLQEKLLNGLITKETAGDLCAALASRKPTILKIDSPGGNYQAGCSIRGSIMHNGKVTGIVVGIAHSMAIPVFQACKIRILVEPATMLLHSGEMTNTMQSLDVFDADIIANWVKKNQEEENAYDDMVLEGIKTDKARYKEFVLTQEKIRKWRRENKLLSAKEALDHGLCDVVLPVQDQYSPELLKRMFG